MIIPDYEFNPYPWEVGTILMDKEDFQLYLLTHANYSRVYLKSLNDGQTYTAHTLNSTDDYQYVGKLSTEDFNNYMLRD